MPGEHAKNAQSSHSSQWFDAFTSVQIFEPTGTVTDAEPPVATILPFSTCTQWLFPGVDWRKPCGHDLHVKAPLNGLNLPGGQAIHEMEPMPDVYVPDKHGSRSLSTPAQVNPGSH